MKIGDKVRCINDKNSNSLRAAHDYVVVAMNDYKNIQVKELNVPFDTLAHFYKPERFILINKNVVEPQKKTIDFSKKYRTRSGQKVNLIGLSQDPDYPVVGEYKPKDGSWSNESWTEDGQYFSEITADDLNLVEVVDEVVIKCSGFNVKVFDDKSIYISFANGSGYPIHTDKAKEIVDAWNSFD